MTFIFKFFPLHIVRTLTEHRSCILLTHVRTVRVPYICDKFHFGWPEGVVFGKRQVSFEHATFAVNRTTRETDLSQSPTFILRESIG